MPQEPFDASHRHAHQSDGFVRIPEFLSADELREVREQLDRYCAELLPQLPAMDAFYEDRSRPDTLKMLPRMSEHDVFFADFLHKSAATRLAEFLWETEVVGKDLAFFDKPPELSAPTPPHQDGYYFHLQPCEAVTLWLALDDVDEGNGCLSYVRGSHRLGMREHARTDTLGFSQGIVGFPTDEDTAHEVKVTARAGDLIAHDALTIHRADKNADAKRRRRALGLVYYTTRARHDRASSEAYQRKLEAELRDAARI